MPQVFISYSHRDAEWIDNHLLPYLDAWELQVVIDHSDFIPGHPLPKTVEAAIAAADRVLFVCTPEFMASQWCRAELEALQALGPQAFGEKAVPVVLDVKSIPAPLHGVTRCDLSQNPDDRSEWRKLCLALGGHWYDFHAEVEALVRAAVAAEFDAYKRLPAIETAPLLEYFSPDGGAYSRITTVLVKHRERGWVINNPHNPSHAVVREMRVKRESRSRYQAFTREDWYLRWYEARTGRYRYIYNVQNEQVYLVESQGGRLAITYNFYPSPRGAAARLRAGLAALWHSVAELIRKLLKGG